MSQKTSNRRAHGTGTLYSQERASGQEFWYGRWHLGGRRVNRRLGPKRRRGTGEGLNHTQAEAKLRELMVRERPPAAGSSVSFASTAELMLRDLEALGRKPTTLDNYRSILRSHLLPRFGEVAVGQVKKSEIEALMTALTEAGKAARTRSGIFKLLRRFSPSPCVMTGASRTRAAPYDDRGCGNARRSGFSTSKSSTH